MFSKRVTVALLVLVIGLTAAGRALAADVLDAIPNTALAVVLVNRLEATSDKIEKLAVKVQAPSVSLLSLVRVQTGIHDGLDEKATGAMAWLPSEDQSLDSPTAIVVLPITDYAKFIAQLQPENAKDKITQVYVAGKAVLACQRGNFAVLAGLDDEAALKDVLASVKSVGDDLSPLRTWLAEVDVAAVATPTAIKLVSTQMGAQLAMAEQQGLAANQPAFKIVQQVLAAAGDELQLAAIGIRADDAGTVRVTTRLRLTPGGQWAATADRVEGPSKSLLTGLPEGPFVLTAAAQYSQPLRGMVNWFFSDEGRKLNPALEKLPADQQAKLADIFGRITDQQESAKIWMGVPQPDEPLFASAMMIAKVDDAKKYFAQIDELAKLHLGAGDDTTPAIFSLGDVKHMQVDGHEAIEYTNSMKQIEAGQPGPVPAPAKAILTKMLGSDEKFRTYMAAIDDHTIVSAYVSVDNLHRAIAAAKKAGSGSGLDPQAAEVAALLPAGAQAVALVQPAGINQWAQLLAAAAADQKQPEVDFPASPPIGLALKISAAGVHADAVIPSATLEAIGEFVAKERNKR